MYLVCGHMYTVGICMCVIEYLALNPLIFCLLFTVQSYGGQTGLDPFSKVRSYS